MDETCQKCQVLPKLRVSSSFQESTDSEGSTRRRTRVEGSSEAGGGKEWLKEGETGERERERALGALRAEEREIAKEITR